jgi:Tol biopolymer transport system component
VTSASAASPAAANLHLSGRIVFERWDATQGKTAVFIANADGNSERQLFARGAEMPHWSPDRKTVSVFCCDDGMVAHLIDVASGAFHEFPPPDPEIEAHCGPWSADGGQLLCESFGTKDRARNGVYAIRSTDGKGLTQLTSSPNGDDLPGSESPDGKRIVFNRAETTGSKFALFVADLGGKAVKQITPWGSVDIGFHGRFSPDGSHILFPSADDGGLWVVGPDGSDLHEVYRDTQGRWAITPTWSPDGKWIMFGLAPSGDISSHPATGLYVVDGQGKNLAEIRPADSYQSDPDWAQ